MERFVKTDEGAVSEGTWAEDCLKERGKVLTGKKRHYCQEWDFLPIDETTPEWPCGCPAEDVGYDADNHPMKSERHSEKAHRCINCGSRIKDATYGREPCSCGTENFCTTEIDRKTNRLVYVTTHYTI